MYGARKHGQLNKFKKVKGSDYYVLVRPEVKTRGQRIFIEDPNYPGYFLPNRPSVQKGKPKSKVKKQKTRGVVPPLMIPVPESRGVLPPLIIPSVIPVPKPKRSRGAPALPSLIAMTRAKK